MADEIIDLTLYLKREAQEDLPRGAMALWGADGERSRFALPLWRIIYLSQAERGVIVSRPSGGGAPVPFVALDLAHEPARTDVPEGVAPDGVDDDSTLRDFEGGGLVVHLGARGGRVWSLFVDGGDGRNEPLDARAREDILFLAGECAGLLFSRDLAEGESAEDDGVAED